LFVDGGVYEGRYLYGWEGEGGGIEMLIAVKEMRYVSEV
jgi:hypothetical protein